MLHQVRAEAPPAQIVATAKRDPAIVLKLLKIGNSPAFGFGRQMSGLEESILVMGRDSLYRWLSIALFKLGNNDGRDQTLLVLALTRGNFLESLAPPGNTTVSEELFLVGLLSVIDVLLGCPLDRVIQQMPLPANLVAVLANDEGPYAPYLSLAITMERCSLVQASLFAAKLKIDITKVIDCYAKAIDFASAELSES
jgi:EAL and modified HD-GYP domain-containing signal transduction protein